VRACEVFPESTSSGRLSLRYRIHGDITALRIPAAGPVVRADELWRHTCFEVFLRQRGQTRYLEGNFSPSGAWALYRFVGYRAGMAVVASAHAPRVSVRVAAASLELRAVLDIGALGVEADGPIELAVAAVLETQAGSLSYWALRHGPGEPDFHHTDSFALVLQPAGCGRASTTRI